MCLVKISSCNLNVFYLVFHFLMTATKAAEDSHTSDVSTRNWWVNRAILISHTFLALGYVT